MLYAPHQLRVIEEQKELQIKLDALTNFIDSDNFTKVVTDEDERYLMIDQETHMKRYNRVLLKRIKNFKGE